ncbi:hypothetical protein KSD_04610 [Ktedonobacter sp. SOSP1-85]|nr:hypothetical protein KSD_04610 [Ktedonobacter sp. SOSP1-85]
MDALVKHVLGLMFYGMSDLGEILEQNRMRDTRHGWNGRNRKGQAQKFFDALKCLKHYMLFDTAQSHCQMGAYSTASEYVFDWLDKRL